MLFRSTYMHTCIQRSSCSSNGCMCACVWVFECVRACLCVHVQQACHPALVPQRQWMHVCMCVRVCMCACVFVRACAASVASSARPAAAMDVCVCACVFVCVRACLCECACVFCVCMCIKWGIQRLSSCSNVCDYSCVCLRAYVCMCVCVCVCLAWYICPWSAIPEVPRP